MVIGIVIPRLNTTTSLTLLLTNLSMALIKRMTNEKGPLSNCSVSASLKHNTDNLLRLQLYVRCTRFVKSSTFSNQMRKNNISGVGNDARGGCCP
jgi:hypothetical protein